MKITRSISKLLVLVLLVMSCEEESALVHEESTNTLNTSVLGSPDNWGHIDEYFDLDKNIDLKFHRYDHNSYSTSIFFDPLVDTVRLRLFEEYEVAVSAEVDPFLVDSTAHELTSSKDDSLWIFSTIFKNVDSLVFNNSNEYAHELQYYTKKKSKEYVKDSSLVTYTDNFDSLIVYVKVDTTLAYGASLLETGTAFLDSTTWEEHKSIVLGESEVGQETYQLSGLKVNEDNLMARINTDCNDNGEWDFAEVSGSEHSCVEDSDCQIGYDCDPNAFNGAGEDGNRDGVCFIDRGNGLYDHAEPGLQNGTLDWDRNTIFQDRNCNGIWDQSESTSDDIAEGDCTDLGGVWLTSGSITFCDIGNGKYDEGEIVTEVDADGDTLSYELFEFSETMSSLLVDYVDSNNPRVMHAIYPYDSLTTKWGVKFTNIIEDFVLYDTISYSYDNIELKKSIFSHPIIQYFEDNIGEPYTIAKSEYSEDGEKKYDYHMFRKEPSGDIVKLFYPEYFKPYGYYDPAVFENAFWRDSLFVNDTIFHTYEGYLRDGESYDTEEIVSLSLPGTILADYLVEKSYSVSKDTLTDFPIIENSDIDTIYCFKVTRETKMTMMGTGVEYIEEDITWLGKNIGIVKNIIEYQWLGVDKYGLSKWELLEDNSSAQDTGDDLGRLFNPAYRINLNELQSLEEMSNDPYVYRRTGTIQRIGE